MSTPRLPIAQIGSFSLSEDEARPSGWAFAFEGQGTVSLDYEDGQIAGWTLEELHAIAHGAPCAFTGCPVT